MSGGPPLLTSWRLRTLVTTLALASEVSTLPRSGFVNLREKKCWLTLTLLSPIQPSVLPSVLRGKFLLPAAGHEGVVTCIAKPSPSSFHATIPFECPHGEPHDSPHPLISGSR